MPEFATVDRQGRAITVKTLDNDRVVLISQDGWREKREIIRITKGGNEPMINLKALDALTVPEEKHELAAMFKGRVRLRRTFNMTLEGVTLRFWRVIAPVNHPNINSDLSIQGLKEWGII